MFEPALRHKLHADADAEKGFAALAHGLIKRLDHARNPIEPGAAVAEGSNAGQDDTVGIAHAFRLAGDENLRIGPGFARRALELGLDYARTRKQFGKAIVYFHPLAPFCCGNLVSGVQDSWIEYPYDSGRAILSLLFNGALAKFRDIRWIFSHSGGALPYLSHRVDYQSRPLKNLKEIAPDGVLNEFRKLYYETANAASGPAIAGLLKLVPTSQVMYGSDFPYVTSEYNLANLRGNGLSDADMTAIEYGNAEKLIPALKS